MMSVLFRPGGRVLVALAVGAALLALAGPAAAGAKPIRSASPPAAKTKKTKPRPHPAPSQAPVAARLTSAALHARTPAAQSRAMLAMMKALGVGVVTPAGKPLSLGAEPAAAGLFELYSSELGPMGASVKAAPALTLDDVATGLTRAGLTLDTHGTAFPTRLLHDSLIAAVKDAVRHPRKPGSLMPLIVRRLGLAEHPSYDLARNPPAAQIRLSSLQSWLLSSDLELSVLRHIRLGALRGAKVLPATVASAPTARPTSALSDACQKYSDASDALQKAEEQAAGGKLSKFVAGKIAGHFGGLITERLANEIKSYGEKNLPSWAVTGTTEYIEKAGNALALATTILQGLHGSLLSASISVHTLGNITSVPDVHWYHQPGEAGHQRTFSIVVEMLDDYGDALIKCGNLAGFKFPPKGGIPGVHVLWDQAEGSLAPDMGTLDCSLAGLACNSTTNEQGIASVTFDPKTETVPGLGLELDSSGVLDGVAAYQTGAGGGLLGQIAQVLVPKFAGLRWRVTYHAQPKLSLHVTDVADYTFTNQTESQYESTGTGSQDFALSSSVPLTPATATDGTTIFSGQAPVNWDAFHFNDDGRHFGVGSDCIGGNSTDDEDGSAPASGQLTVDSVIVDAAKGPAGLKVTLQTTSDPSYTKTSTFHADTTTSYPCRDSTYSGSIPYAFPSQIYGLGSGVSSSGSATNTSSAIITVTGWTPGPGAASGTGVYAYRDVSYSTTDHYGQPTSGEMRLELVASPGG